MAGSKPTPSRLTPGELKIMQILWEHGELKPPQIQELFPESIKNPALRSYLAILVEKGHLERRRDGRAYFYKAVTPRNREFGAMLKQLINTFCNGSTKQLMLNLVRSEKLSADDLEELRQIAESETSSQPKVRVSQKPNRRNARKKR